MAQESPLVSVGIPTYNNPDGLRNTLKCITAQTYKNLEIIVSDNCSDTLMAPVVGEFDDPRIKYFKQAKNVGGLKNFEFVLKQATGQYFMWAADDDGWEPDFISELLAVMKPDAIVSFCNYEKRGKINGIEFLTELLREVQPREVLDMAFSLKKINVAAYGLFNLGELRRLLPDGFPKCDAPDRVMFAHFGLKGKTVVLSPRVLHWRTTHSGSFAVRHGGTRPNRVLKIVRDWLSRMRYYAECVRFLWIDAKGNKLSDLLYYVKKLMVYIVMGEVIYAKTLPRTLKSLVYSLRHACLKGVKKCVQLSR